MSKSFTRRINLYINGKEIKNDVASIRAEMKKLTAQQSHMTRGSTEYQQKTREIRRLRGILAEHNQSLRATTSLWQKAKNAFSQLLPVAGIAGIAASLAGMVRKMNVAIDAADNFEERLDNLSALTGLEGRALEELGETAKRTSVKITEGGVRIKQSADDIVDAYTKVGSQRPELLKNGEALASVSEDAIILSEAAKSELEPAVKGLTTTMNQFNIGAEGSRRIINAMAAGSKEGAADIPYLTEATEKSGTTMHLLNVSLEENIGLIEAIAPNYAKAEMAGNSLDKVFLKLKEKQIGYKDGVFSVNAALDELAERYKNGESAASLFGVEHAKMGELLVQNKDEFNRYTKAVTGTNVAIEQAAKNTNNAKAIQAQARNEFKLAAIELGQNLSPAMVKVYQAAGFLASAFSKLISKSPVKILQDEQREVHALAVELTSANTGEDRRRQILEQLNGISPKIVAGLSAEDIEVGKLKENLRLYNEELANRIVLENLSEDEEKQAAKVAKQMELVSGYQYKINQIIGETNEDIALSSASFEEKVSKTFDALKQKSAEYNKTVSDSWLFDENENEAGKKLVHLGALMESLRISQEKLSTAQANQSDLSNRIQGMKEILGLTHQITHAENGGGNGTGGGENGKKLAEFLTLSIEQQKQAINDYFAKAGDGAFDAFMAAIEKSAESKQIDVKAALKYQTEETETEDPALDYAIQQYQETLDYKQALLEAQYQHGIIAEQEYQDRLNELNRQGEEKRYNEKMQYADKARQLSDMGVNFIMSLMELELSKAGDNEEKKAKIRKKYANAQFLTTASQIVVDTAAAIMKALAQLGPIAGAIAAGIIGATGAVQLGIANAERQKMLGYAVGGYTKGETVYIAGERGQEWIGPNWMLQQMPQLFDNLEAMRRRKVSVNPAVIPKFADGGYTGSQSNNFGFDPAPQNFEFLATAVNELRKEIKRFQKWKPKIFSELIKKDIDELSQMEKNSGF